MLDVLPFVAMLVTVFLIQVFFGRSERLRERGRGRI